MNKKLEAITKAAAKAAFDAGVRAGDEPQLIAWIRANVHYRPESEFFVFFLIGADLADLEAQAEGYRDQGHRAWEKIPADMKQRHFENMRKAY